MILQLEEAEKNARLARKSAREQGKILMKIACSKEFFQYTVYILYTSKNNTEFFQV